MDIRAFSAQTKSMRLVCVIFCIAWALLGASTPPRSAILPSAKHIYPEQRLSSKGIREIRVSGIKGQLQFRGSKRDSNFKLHVQHSSHPDFEDWQLMLERRGHVLHLEVLSLQHGSKWREQLSEDKWPEFDVEIEGPSLPAVVSWREGTLEFNRWDANLEISLTKGQVRLAGGHGDLRLHGSKVDINLSSRHGQIMLRGETGKVQLQSIEGDIDINWLQGQLGLTDCRGQVSLDVRSASLEVQGGSGDLRVALQKGIGRVRDFAGDVRVSGERANWKLKARAPSELHATSTSGPIELEWEGGARVFLTTTKGKVTASKNSYLHSAQREGRRIYAGQKDGTLKGEVFVRTQSGPIFWLESLSQ